MSGPTEPATQFLGVGTPEPTDLAGRAPALLAFHGFGATPRELDPVADVARASRRRVLVPLFPGHGTHPRDLAQTRFADWYRCGEDALARLRREFPDRAVVVGGLSTGALVAMRLAAEHPEAVRALIVLSNALTLTAPYPAWPLAMLHYLHAPDFSLRKNGPDIADPEGRARQLTYSSQPMRAAADLQRSGAEVRAMLSRIRCPVFVAHGEQDHVCPVKNAWDVANAVATNDVEVMILRRSFHIVTQDFERIELCERIAAFLERVAPHPAPVEP